MLPGAAELEANEQDKTFEKKTVWQLENYMELKFLCPQINTFLKKILCLLL